MKKKFNFFRGDATYELEFDEIEKRFEAYILHKTATPSGMEWLKEFTRGPLQTIALIIHFLYDSDWCDRVIEHQEDELIHLLSPVKIKIFKQLF